MRVPACPKFGVALIHTSLTYVYDCAGGGVFGPVPTGGRKDRHGHPLCEICGDQRRGAAVRPYTPGWAHQSCIKAQSRQAVATHTPVARQKRPYDTLRSTQQWKRKQLARTAVEEVLQQVGCPLSAIHPPSTPSPAELLHLTISTGAQRHRRRPSPSCTCCTTPSTSLSGIAS